MMLAIIIPVYNHATELEQCLRSIFQQTLFANSRELANRRGKEEREKEEVEIIVVNDGSIDEISNFQFPISKMIQERGLSLQWIDQEHRGAAAARNTGFDASSGRYLFFCDADIRLEPNCLEKMINALEQNPDAAFAYSQFQFGWKTFSSFPFDPERLKRLNYIHTSSLIRREWFPRFDERLKKFQDWDLFLTITEGGSAQRTQGRAERSGRGVLIPEVLFAVATGGTMSQWVPSFAYRWPRQMLPWWKKVVQKYEQVRILVQNKHGIQI